MGPECSCDSCTISHSPDSVVSGSWSGAGTSSLSTSSSAGVVVTTGQAKVTATAIQASATITPTNVTEGGRVILGYIDANNYHFVELRKGSTDGDLRIFQRSGGVDTQLGTTTTVTGYTSGSKKLCACYYNGTLFAIVGAFVASAAATITAASSKAGVGTGSLTASVTFDNFVFEHHYIDDPTCPSCCQGSSGTGTPGDGFGIQNCSACEPPYPEFMLLAVAGLANGGFGGGCTTCAGYNTAWVIPYAGFYKRSTGPSWPLDGRPDGCVYYQAFPAKSPACGIGNTTLRVTYWFINVSGFPGWGSLFQELGGFGSGPTWEAYGDDGTNWTCMAPADQNLISDNDGLTILTCDASAATVSASGF